jgi:hypothetical protein
MHEALNVHLPSAQLEVKIVLTIPFCGGLRGACCRRTGILLSRSVQWLKGDSHTRQ